MIVARIVVGRITTEGSRDEDEAGCRSRGTGGGYGIRGGICCTGCCTSGRGEGAQTLKWKLNEIASHEVGRHGFVTADRIRSVRTGKIVGYDSVSGEFDPATNKVVIDVAFSVRGGILVARVRADFDSDEAVFRGPVLKGTGRFAGAEGTIAAKPVGDGGRTLVTIGYRV